MMRSRAIFVSYLLLCAVPACGGGDGDTADPPNLGPGSAGEQGDAGSGWGSAGTSGELDAGQAGSAGESGSAGATSTGGSAGAAGSDGSGGSAGDGSGGSAGDGSGGSGGDGGIGGLTGNGGSSGKGGSGGIGGLTGNGGSSGKGGSGGIGGLTGNGGSSGSGGTGGYVGLIPFAASVSSTDFLIMCSTSGAYLGGKYTAKYSNILLSTPTQAAVVKSHALLKKNGVTMSYSFPVDPVASPKVAQGTSATVVHKALKGSGTANMCNFCDATMTLEVEWLLSNGEKRSDITDPFTVKCFVPI